MSKFFDELMESVQEMDEILRSEQRASYKSEVGKQAEKSSKFSDGQRSCKHRKSQPISPYDCATLWFCTKRPMP
ncbi:MULTISPECIES: hypothetical protein [Pseudomonas]|uniref:Uncharacterized protein n=2 Tax=Pseudomonas TaxID=286 RepID=A0AA94JIV5_9PSED|nr:MULTISPECIES: hypothetical protein [Pseudomonas]RVD78419.1 hypothetical protein A9HBioS_1605 [Pseudomonas koreensis]WDR38731.1 hypothetical protein NN484_13605 [Pseudomonas serboccidentalis]